MKIQIIDSVMCHTDAPALIKECLSVRREFWKLDRSSGYPRRVRKEYDACLIAKDGTFLSGFFPRVIEFCRKNSIPVTVEGSFKKLDFSEGLDPPGITLFEDQKKLIQTILISQRGVLQAPTGTGKTILCYAIISLFKTRKSLIICPSKSIMRQTAKEFEEKFKMKTSMVGDGVKDLSGDVVVAIVNSLRRMPEESYHDLFDIVIVDESHHSASFSGMFFDVMTNILAPVRIGVTATSPNKEKEQEKSMACEGLIGPTTGIFSVADAVESGRLAKPKLILLSIPKNNNLRDLRTYHEIYTMGIVRNRMRNNTIANFVKGQAAEGNTSLVFTKLLEHADLLEVMLIDKGVNCKIVNGAVSGQLREELRSELQNKQIQCIIATSAWKEGINLPSLNCVINGAGYLSSTPIIQMAGRGLRVSEGKDEALIVDFLDIGRYLSDHCVERLQTYKELGWL
jgi:superfamily II DNA or RNA helicase